MQEKWGPPYPHRGFVLCFFGGRGWGCEVDDGSVLAKAAGGAGELAGDPVVGGALGGCGACVTLTALRNGVKVEVDGVPVHEVAVDDVVHVAVQVLGEHVDVQVGGQPVLAGEEAAGAGERAHGLETAVTARQRHAAAA